MENLQPEVPLFPVEIKATDFDRNGETQHGAGQIFQESNKYVFQIFGKSRIGTVKIDFGLSIITSRLRPPRKDMRQMKVRIEADNLEIESSVYVTYYELSDGNKEVVDVLAKKK